MEGFLKEKKTGVQWSQTSRLRPRPKDWLRDSLVPTKSILAVRHVLM